jgi:galactose mutarotase-like enzyme
MSIIDWHGFEGHVLENDTLRVVIVPALGAKIVSLIHKSAHHEWLAAPTHSVRARKYSDTFIDHDLAGWDEMFPTIVTCQVPHEPAVMLPDHGEVWALPWVVLGGRGGTLELQVNGRALSYVLTRTAALMGNTLRLDYRLQNLSEMPLPFLWAAHPLFNADGHTHIELPASVTKVINAVDHPL